MMQNWYMLFILDFSLKYERNTNNWIWMGIVFVSRIHCIMNGYGFHDGGIYEWWYFQTPAVKCLPYPILPQVTYSSVIWMPKEKWVWWKVWMFVLLCNGESATAKKVLYCRYNNNLFYYVRIVTWNTEHSVISRHKVEL